MSTLEASPSKLSRTDLLEILTSDRRRRALAVLRDHSGRVSVAALSADLAADAGSDSQRVRFELRHTHLPKLAAAGLVSWDDEAGTVRTVARPPGADRRLERLLEAADRHPDVIGAVADEQRRRVLAALDDGADSLDDLAREAAAADAGRDSSPGAVEDLRIRLHHVHLPALEAAGLVDYDADDNAVSYLGLPDGPARSVRSLLH